MVSSGGGRVGEIHEIASLHFGVARHSVAKPEKGSVLIETHDGSAWRRVQVPQEFIVENARQPLLFVEGLFNSESVSASERGASGS